MEDSKVVLEDGIQQPIPEDVEAELDKGTRDRTGSRHLLLPARKCRKLCGFSADTCAASCRYLRRLMQVSA